MPTSLIKPDFVDKIKFQLVKFYAPAQATDLTLRLIKLKDQFVIQIYNSNATGSRCIDSPSKINILTRNDQVIDLMYEFGLTDVFL